MNVPQFAIFLDMLAEWMIIPFNVCFVRHTKRRSEWWGKVNICLPGWKKMFHQTPFWISNHSCQFYFGPYFGLTPN